MVILGETAFEVAVCGFDQIELDRERIQIVPFSIKYRGRECFVSPDNAGWDMKRLER